MGPPTTLFHFENDLIGDFASVEQLHWIPSDSEATKKSGMI
ncbi:unnamed protein product [Haemonchus placei]|uniref:Uncharacterized protein n=1 Tax=Haemonchus placei TaxID=6290 RepID=A0A0N4W6E0_HAEPC|nr:unnamed protein product [Haemonchus placei]